MKFKHLIVAVAALAFGTAMAQSNTGGYYYGQPNPGPYGDPLIPVPTLTPLRATFALNTLSFDPLSPANANISARTIDPANTDSNKFQWNSTTRSGDFSLTSVVTQGSQLASAASDGSSLLLKRTIMLDDEVTIVQRELFWTNLSFDLTTGVISGDWKLRVRESTESGPIGTPVVTDFGRLAVFQAAQVQGGQIVTTGYATATTNASFSGLKFSATSANVFLTALGLSTEINDPVASIVRDTSWASVTISAVPEPSTYALMGLGMLLVGAAASRRRAS